MYSILFGGDSTVHIGGGTTEIVGHAHVYKDRPGEVSFKREERPLIMASIVAMDSHRFIAPMRWQWRVFAASPGPNPHLPPQERE